MKRLTYLMSGLVLTAALALPAETWAQARPSGGGSSGGQSGGSSGGARTPSSGGGGGGGQAVSRGSSGGGGSTSSSGGGSSATAPTPSGGSSGGAVSRPSGSRSPGRDVRSLGTGEQRGEAVPRGSRPNTGNPAVGRAVPREGRPPVVGGGGGGGYYWPGSYYGGYYGYPYWGYGSYWGLGAYSFYNPFYWGYGYPFYGASPLWDTWGSIYPGYYGGSVYAAPSGTATGDLKLKVKPREAEVYVDGYFAGLVDNFDGLFQKLKIEPGAHRVEIRAEGYEPVTFEVRVIPGESITYKGELKRVE